MEDIINNLKQLKKDESNIEKESSLDQETEVIILNPKIITESGKLLLKG